MKTLTHIVDALIAIQRRADQSRYLVTLAIALWLAISGTALLASSPEFFSRAGAVGTGMVLVSFAAVGAARSSYQTLLFKGLVLVMRGEHQGKSPQNELDYDRNLEAIGRLFIRVERRGRLARIAEMAAALVATLQWGYGDLVVNKIMLCGEWKC